MTREHKIKLLQALREYTKKHTVSEQAAKEALINEGIFEADGTLAAEYGFVEPA